jgi:hypothetical protein
MSAPTIVNPGNGPTTSQEPVEVVHRTTAEPCSVHAAHKPTSHVNEIHHVWPLGQGGPNRADNRVVVCGTGHNSIHQLIAEYLTMKGAVPYSLLKQYTMGERQLAKLGYDRITRGAM